MPSLEKREPMPRKELNVFYVLDTSGSMSGTPIAILNRAMIESTEALKELAKDNADALLKIAVLEFNSNCKWITVNGPESLEGDFMWQDLTAFGGTYMGQALTELNSKLSKNGYLKSMTGALMPVIIFMTDGYANDSWQGPLDKIRGNKWFERATKIGFAIGDDADAAMLASIVGGPEAVIQTADMELFKKLMRFVSVTSSMLASKSSTTNTVTTGKDVVQQAIAENNLSSSSVTPDLAPDSYTTPPPTNTDDNFEDDDWD